MKIAVLGPVTWRTPPLAYGPWERFVSLLTEGLVARGLDVTLFATLDSVTSAKLDGVRKKPSEADDSRDDLVQAALHIAHCFERSGEFDIVHNNLDWLPLAMHSFCQPKMVTTIHGFSSPKILPAYQKAIGHSTYVSISDADRSPKLPYAQTIYHGIDMKEFNFSPKSKGYLLTFGRIDREKGVGEAIKIAKLAKMPLIICGLAYDKKYWSEEVEPYVDGKNVQYLGDVGPVERSRILGGAVALLHPIAFDEPFGFSIVEAMACGTPVIAYSRGSMPEIIENNVSGFLVHTVDQAVKAVPNAATLDRAAIRQFAERRFNVDRMIDEYIALYKKVLS